MRRLAYLTLWLFVFTIPWQNCLSLESIGTISQAVGLVAFITTVLFCVSTGKLLRPGPTLLLTAAFATYALLSTAWSLDPATTLLRAETIFQLLAMFWLISELVDDSTHVHNILLAYLAGATVSVIATFAQFVAGNANQDLRYAAAGFNPNDQALTLALAIPLSWFLAMQSRSLWARFLLITYLAIAPVAIALSGSRTGALACGTALLFSCFGIRRVRWSRQLMLAMAFGVCAWCALSMVPETSWSRILTISEQVDSGDLNQRISVWAAGARAFVEHPLFGVGEGAYLQVSSRYYGEGFVAHNTFLSVLVELGITGFLCFAAILLSTARSIRNLINTDRSMWIAVAATWFVGVLASTWETQKPTWLFIALIAAAARAHRSSFDMTLCDEPLPSRYEFSR
jgi:O-antigen ligase